MAHTPDGRTDRLLATYLVDIGRIPLLKRDEELSLARATRCGDTAARALLITSNLRLVIMTAKRYQGYGIPLTDLIQEGNIGLIEGVDRFDPELGWRLSTYASHWIRAMITKYVIAQWSLVKVGTTQAQRKLFFTLKYAEARIVAMEGRVDDDLLAKELDVTAKEIRTMRSRMNRPVSLDAPSRTSSSETDEKLTLKDAIPADSPSAAEIIDKRALMTLVKKVIAEQLTRETLDERELFILEQRLLVDKDDAATLATIGEQLDLSRERIRQIENRLKQKLAHAFIAAGIDPTDVVRDGYPHPSPPHGPRTEERNTK